MRPFVSSSPRGRPFFSLYLLSSLTFPLSRSLSIFLFLSFSLWALITTAVGNAGGEASGAARRRLAAGGEGLLQRVEQSRRRGARHSDCQGICLWLKVSFIFFYHKEIFWTGVQVCGNRLKGHVFLGIAYDFSCFYRINSRVVGFFFNSDSIKEWTHQLIFCGSLLKIIVRLPNNYL